MEDFTHLPDVSLVQRVQEHACSQSFNELSKRHSNLFYKVCQSYIKTLVALGYCTEDIFEERDFVLFKAITKFKSDKGAQFSTWLGNYTRYFCLNKINDMKDTPEVTDINEVESVFNDTSIKEFESKQPEVSVDNIFSTLKSSNDPRITNVFKLRYDPDTRKKRTWAKIAKELNLTVQTTMALHKRGLKLLREEISKENLDVYQDS